MQQPEPHPDHLLHQQQARAITRGSRQAADDKAMEAMFDAIEGGVGKEQAEKIFNDTYIKVLYGKEKRMPLMLRGRKMGNRML